jgi:hypothetical protein
MTDDDMDRLFDEIISSSEAWGFFMVIAKHWLGNESSKTRQGLNWYVVDLMKRAGVDPVSAHAFQRGVCVGLDAASQTYHGRVRQDA